MSAQPAPSRFESNSHRFYNTKYQRWMIKIMPGGAHVTNDKEELVSTVLGSCVAACICDPVAGVGGMNHFMLPHDDAGLWSGASLALRFGNHAMESLINEILKMGGHKDRLECKFFGGGNVMKGLSRVGDKNALFARKYAQIEALHVLQWDLGGEKARQIMFDPITGQAWRRFVDATAGDDLVKREKELVRKPVEKIPAGSIELF